MMHPVPEIETVEKVESFILSLSRSSRSRHLPLSDFTEFSDLSCVGAFPYSVAECKTIPIDNGDIRRPRQCPGQDALSSHERGVRLCVYALWMGCW